ncbi:hypothetical protein BDV95DRAFT_281499 [Massariosphaeria phaeospora]|uniref:Uncharacterized protein n=1 Tax=Massariosphaeria phaeospora TaxID=100035 RepID=A0A7C8MEK1_9PLEO|nr:hypothetical protein BDV95DRAFT_281499 [Massariosphaeria phaeospora]
MKGGRPREVREMLEEARRRCFGKSDWPALFFGGCAVPSLANKLYGHGDQRVGALNDWHAGKNRRSPHGWMVITVDHRTRRRSFPQASCSLHIMVGRVYLGGWGITTTLAMSHGQIQEAHGRGVVEASAVTPLLSNRRSTSHYAGDSGKETEVPGSHLCTTSTEPLSSVKPSVSVHGSLGWEGCILWLRNRDALFAGWIRLSIGERTGVRK